MQNRIRLLLYEHTHKKIFFRYANPFKELYSIERTRKKIEQFFHWCLRYVSHTNTPLKALSAPQNLIVPRIIEKIYIFRSKLFNWNIFLTGHEFPFKKLSFSIPKSSSIHPQSSEAFYNRRRKAAARLTKSSHPYDAPHLPVAIQPCSCFSTPTEHRVLRGQQTDAFRRPENRRGTALGGLNNAYSQSVSVEASAGESQPSEVEDGS